MLPDKKIKCHLTGFTKSCYACVTQSGCRKWVQLTGTNPQTGEILNKWDCVDQFQILLMLEQNRKLNELGAAIESFRNETIRLNTVERIDTIKDNVKNILEAAKQKVVDHG